MSASTSNSGRASYRRRGFTLVEVMTAIVIAGVLAWMAHATVSAGLAVLTDVTESRRALDRSVNARRWLGAMLASVEVDKDRGPFMGTENGLSFVTWRQTPEGWTEPTEVQLRWRAGQLVARAGDVSIVLDTGAVQLSFEYLASPSGEDRWVKAWSSPVGAPFAVRVRRVLSSGPVDTTMYLVGRRG